MRFRSALPVLLVAAVAAVLALTREQAAPARLYADDSPLNEPVPAGAATDPRSPEMIRRLIGDARGGLRIAAGVWTQPIYYADSSTPRHDVLLTHRPYRGRRLLGVPLPDGAKPSPDGDSTLVVVDRDAGCEYDFQQLRRSADGWLAHFGNALSTGGSGIYPFAESPRASGFANAAGVILPDELRAGRIPHALAFVMQHTRLGGPVPPATGSDGWSGAPGAIPEGARLRLDPAFDLESVRLEPWQRTVAEALRDYGMFLVDTGGSFGLQAQLAATVDGGYPWGDVEYAELPAELLARLQVLELPAQFETVYRFVPGPCARLSPAGERE